MITISPTLLSKISFWESSVVWHICWGSLMISCLPQSSSFRLLKRCVQLCSVSYFEQIIVVSWLYMALAFSVRFFWTLLLVCMSLFFSFWLLFDSCSFLFDSIFLVLFCCCVLLYCIGFYSFIAWLMNTFFISLTFHLTVAKSKVFPLIHGLTTISFVSKVSFVASWIALLMPSLSWSMLLVCLSIFK